MQTPKADISTNVAIAQALLHSQYPALAEEEITEFETGWDNTIYRIGEGHVLRLPRRVSAISCLDAEQKWLSVLAPRLTLPVPAPLYNGTPTPEYSAPWSILPWLPGKPIDLAPLDLGQGSVLAEFLLSLHQPAPQNAPHNAWRGVSLVKRQESVEKNMAALKLETQDITPAIEALWAEALAAPNGAQRTWLHGDLHARNALSDDGKLCAIIDWGDMCAGDPATDLASIWTLLCHTEDRAAAIAQYAPDNSLLARAKGWAIMFASVLLETGRKDHPRHAQMGRDIFKRLEADWV